MEKTEIENLKKIEREKADFLIENKDALICNFSSINYLLFSLLMSDKNIEEIEEYKEIKKVISNKYVIEQKYLEASELIYYLSSILNKLCINSKQKNKYTTKLYSYLDYFKEENKPLIKRKISA